MKPVKRKFESKLINLDTPNGMKEYNGIMNNLMNNNKVVSYTTDFFIKTRSFEESDELGNKTKETIQQQWVRIEYIEQHSKVNTNLSI